MVNTRGKIKKTCKTLQSCFPQPSSPDSDHQFIPTAALVGSNDDLLTEILLRLPVKSVLRFKSVSKHWCSLISHRSFSLRKPVSTSPGLFLRNLYISFDIKSHSSPPINKLDFYPDLRGIRIVQSCKGLLLCCSDRGNERDRKYYVFNPTTKQFAVLPSVPGGRDVRKSIRFMALAFDQTESTHYKVVCIHRANLNNNEMFQVQVYSSQTGKWRISGESFSAPHYMPFRCATYWNKAIFWSPSCTNPLYFKIDDEKLESMPMPSPSLKVYYDGLLPLYFGESRGHLHLVESNGDSLLHLNIYEMENDGSGWFVKYQVELDELPKAFPEMIQGYLDPSSRHYYDFEVFCVVRGEAEEDTFMVVRMLTKVVRYNIMEKSFNQIFGLEDSFRYFHGLGSSDGHLHVESLASF